MLLSKVFAYVYSVEGMLLIMLIMRECPLAAKIGNSDWLWGYVVFKKQVGVFDT